MGGKASNYLQSDRPESGGADKDGIREKNGLLEREKEQFAKADADKHASTPEQQTNANHAPFTIDNEPNSDPRK